MSNREILTEQRDRVGIITLNRPDKLNAMTDTMLDEISQQVQAWNQDESVGAIILTGAGRAFCSGGDVSRFEEAVRAGPERAKSPILTTDWLRVATQSKPLICAINGLAVGIGITMTLPCDIRIAAEGSKISFRFIRIGLTPELASTHYLANFTGLGMATELMLTGRFIEAEEAQSIGLVNHVYPAESLFDKTISLATDLADLPDWHLREIKRLIHNHYLEKNSSVAQAQEAKIFKEAMMSEAHREALNAFREKRAPRFH